MNAHHSWPCSQRYQLFCECGQHPVAPHAEHCCRMVAAPPPQVGLGLDRSGCGLVNYLHRMWAAPIAPSVTALPSGARTRHSSPSLLVDRVPVPAIASHRQQPAVSEPPGWQGSLPCRWTGGPCRCGPSGASAARLAGGGCSLQARHAAGPPPLSPPLLCRRRSPCRPACSPLLPPPARDAARRALLDQLDSIRGRKALVR